MELIKPWLLAFSLLIPAFGVLASGAGTGDIRMVDVAGIKNYSVFQGTETFAGKKVGFGGATEANAMSWLKSQGFSTVINLRVAEADDEFDGERRAAQAAGLNYIQLPLDPKNPAPGVVDNFLRVTGDKLNRPIYIHCNSASRVAAMWMIGRLQVDGLERSAAEAEVEAIAAKPQDAIAFAMAYLSANGE